MSDILRQIPGAGPLLIRDGMPVRDSLAVDDAARVFALLARSDVRCVANFGSGVGTRIRAVAQTALALGGEAGRQIAATCPVAPLSVDVLGVTGTKKKLGCTPSLTLAKHMNAFFSGRVLR